MKEGVKVNFGSSSHSALRYGSGNNRPVTVDAGANKRKVVIELQKTTTYKRTEQANEEDALKTMDSVHTKTLAASFKLSSNSELAMLNNRQSSPQKLLGSYHVSKKSDLHKLFAKSHHNKNDI